VQAPIATDCAVLHVLLPPAGGVTATIEAMPACTGEVLPAVAAASYQKGAGSGSGPEFKPLTLSLAIANGTAANEYGEPAALLIDLAHSVVLRPIGLSVTGRQLTQAANADGTALSSDQLPGAAFWMYTGLLGPSARLKAGEQSALREIQLGVVAGVEEFTVPVYTRMRVITVSSEIGTAGGVLEHPAGASVEIPSGSFEVPVQVRIEEVPPLASQLPPASGAFKIQVMPEATPARSILGLQPQRALALSSTFSRIYHVTLDLTQTVQTETDVAVQAALSNAENLYYAAETKLVQTKNAVQATLRQFGENVAIQLQGAYTFTVSCDDQYNLSQVLNNTVGDIEGRPVVFIHGIQLQAPTCLLWRTLFHPENQGVEIFQRLSDAQLSTRLQYWRYTYPTFKHIDSAASKLALALVTHFPRRRDIIVIAHSMGGLVARAAISRHGAGAQISHLITLGTPHGGVPLAEPLAYGNAFLDFDLADLSQLDQNAVSTFAVRLLIDRLAKGVVPWLILAEDGAQDLQPRNVADLLDAGLSEPVSRYFTFGGTLQLTDFNPYQCADTDFECQFVLLGFLANRALDLGPSDGFVPSSSTSLKDANNQDQALFGPGYDHFELHTGDGARFSLDNDPVLTRVASIVADAVAPSPLFFSVPGRNIRGIAYDAGALWVTHSDPAVSDVTKISKIDAATGTILATSNDLNWNSRGITVGAGSLWVADALADVIHRVDPSNFSEIGSPFRTPGTEPTGIAFDGTDLWLTDPFFQRVYHLSTSGAVLPGSFSILNLFRQGLEWDGTGFWTNTGPTEQSHYLKDGTINGVRSLQGLPNGTSIGDIAIGNGKAYLSAGDRIYIPNWQPLEPPGSLGVFTLTSGSNLDPDGYVVNLDGSNGQAVGINGSVGFSGIAAGDHTLELSGIASNCAMIGPNRRTVRVPGGGAAESTFHVGCGTSTRAQPTLTTSAIPTTATLGEFINDVATLASGASPSGVIDFLAFGPNATCPDQASLVLALAVNGNGDYSTLAVPQARLADRTGTWHWIAIYEGDANNWPANSGCDDEPVIVN
jgi:pimeloyl-ACP methyl ester carboxylesterase